MSWPGSAYFLFLFYMYLFLKFSSISFQVQDPPCSSEVPPGGRPFDQPLVDPPPWTFWYLQITAVYLRNDSFIHSLPDRSSFFKWQHQAFNQTVFCIQFLDTYSVSVSPFPVSCIGFDSSCLFGVLSQTPPWKERTLTSRILTWMADIHSFSLQLHTCWW